MTHYGARKKMQMGSLFHRSSGIPFIFFIKSWQVIADSIGISGNNTLYLAQVVRWLLLITLFLSMVACATQEKSKLRYVSNESIYPAVAYVFNLLSAKIVKADVIQNDYVSSYIRYTGWGRINRFRFYVSIRDQVITTEIADVQTQVFRGGFESWQNDSVSSLADVEQYTQNITDKIIRAIKEPTNSEATKKKLLGDLNFSWIVLTDMEPQRRQEWVAKNMEGREYRFNSQIERILKAQNKKKYGKYLVKMSSEHIESKSKINLEFYSDHSLYTRLHIGDLISVTGRLVEAQYSDQTEVLSVVLSDSQ